MKSSVKLHWKVNYLQQECATHGRRTTSGPGINFSRPATEFFFSRQNMKVDSNISYISRTIGINYLLVR